jgi:endopeptidase Clp ATP-binding regulatory subunit (clpX)
MGLTCSFCGAKKSSRVHIHQGATANICQDCIELLFEQEIEGIDLDKASIEGLMKPHEIKAELDKFVIGQEDAKRILSVEVYNHYKRLANKSKTEIDKTNLMLVGPTGGGKTFLLKVLSRILNVPFVIASATGLTESGYVGKDVETMLVSLIEKCNGDVKLAEKGIIYIDEIDKIVAKNADIGRSRDVGGEGVQQALLTIIEGAEVVVEVPDPILRKKSVTINTKNILFICGGAFVGIDEIIKKRQNPKKSKSLGFNLEAPVNPETPITKIGKVDPVDILGYGFIGEFVGRVPLVVTLEKLTEKDLVDILTKVNNSIVKQYKTLFKMDDVKLSFDKEALEYVAKEAIKRNVGARGLRGILADKMNQLMYDIPMQELKEFTVTKEYLESK